MSERFDRAAWIGLACVCLIVNAGCESAPAANSEAPLEETLEARIDRLEAAQQARALSEVTTSVAYLKPTDREYGRVQSELGTIVVAIEGVSADANGSRIKLVFGNPAAAALHDVSATIEWGRVDNSGAPTGQTFSKKYTFPFVPGGSWRRFPVNLADVPPGELGYIRVRDFAHESISLANSN